MINFCFAAELIEDDIENQNHHAPLEQNIKIPITEHNLYETTTKRIQEFFLTPIMKEYACQTLSTVTGGIILYSLHYSFDLSQQHA